MEIRGVRLRKNKAIKRGSGLFVLRPPEYFSVPLIADDGEHPQRAVNVGDYVKEGTVIAKPSGRYGTYVYSPCSGKVVGVVRKLNASGKECEHVLIVRDLKEERETLPVLDDSQKDQENLLKRLYESGMMDNFPPYDPAYKKYLLKCPIKSLIINCTEDDPYQMAESALLETYVSEIVEGARLLKKVAKAENLVFVFSTANSRARKVLKDHLKKLQTKTIKIKIYPSIYPLHNSRVMAYYETGKMLPEGSRTAQASVIVDSVSNCFDFYQAVTNGYPCTCRAVTVAGNNALRKANYFIKNGTPFEHILNVVGYTEEYTDNMLIYGGIMSGIAQETLDISAGLTSSVIIFSNSEEYASDTETPCINCGRCLSCCPVRLNVKKLDDLVCERNYAGAKRLGVSACIECGACSYVCPAKRYLAQRMAFAKGVAEGRTGKRPSSSDYVLVEGEDLLRGGAEFETKTKKLDNIEKQSPPAIDDMLKILSEKTDEEAKKEEEKKVEAKDKKADNKEKKTKADGGKK